MSSSGALALVVAAASVSQLVQFAGEIFWCREPLHIPSAVHLGGAPQPEVRFCSAAEAEPAVRMPPEAGFFEDLGK